MQRRAPYEYPLRLLRHRAFLDKKAERLPKETLRPVPVNSVVETLLGNNDAGLTVGIVGGK